MPAPLSKQTQFGRYSLEKDGRLIVAHFSGALSESLARGYHQGIMTLARAMPGPWGYVADCVDYQASTPEAMSILEQVYRDSLANGCVGDTYYINSAMGIAQLEKIRSRVITTSSIYDRLYADLASAKQAMAKQLSQDTNE